MQGIYKITNKINGKIYIGQSVDIYRRWKDEKTRAFNQNSSEYNTKKSRAFRKYGLENFLFEVVEECSKEQLDEKERFWINKYDSYTNGYNETLGGQDAVTSNKITEDILNQIINLLIENLLTEQDIADKYSLSVGIISEINQGKAWKQEGLQYPLRTRVNNGKKCPHCGKCIDRHASVCRDCYTKQAFSGHQPSKEELKEFINLYKGNITKISEHFNISRSPIKRLISLYSLEDYLQEIKNSKNVKKKCTKVIDEQGNIFNSPADANRFYKIHHAKEVCDGKRKSCGGHVFKWLD